jgi:hypothetical protein
MIISLQYSAECTKVALRCRHRTIYSLEGVFPAARLAASAAQLCLLMKAETTKSFRPVREVTMVHRSVKDDRACKRVNDGAAPLLTMVSCFIPAKSSCRSLSRNLLKSTPLKRSPVKQVKVTNVI